MDTAEPFTKQKNLLALLAGEAPRWVPFSVNFFQWFTHHQRFKTLPQPLAGCRSYIEAMKVLGCDIFSRNVDGGERMSDPKAQRRLSIQQAETGPRTTTSYDTPFGILTSVSQEQTMLSTQHDEEYLVKDWNADGDAFRWLLEQRETHWDEKAYLATADEIGDDGLVNVPCFYTPLKMLHLNFGLDYACLFIADYPDAAKELCDLFWKQQVLPVLRQLADHEKVRSAILMDNVDTPFYSPALVAEFWEPYVREATALMRAREKALFVHACGKLQGLSTVFAKSRVSGLEGVTHPPIGDWSASRAQACHDRFIFIGGFSAREQEMLTDREVKDFYSQYLPTVEKRRCIFAASCQTSINTTWERLVLVRDICREWGGCPHR